MTPTPDEPLLRTALYDGHVAAGARMVPFGGWLMPIQYRGIIAEHLAVREAVGLFDLSHMGRLRFPGEGGRRLLQRLSTNNIDALEPGRAQYGLLCNERGGILDDTVAYNLGDHHLLVVNASNRPKVLDWIGRQPGADAVEVEDTTLGTVMLGLQGPRAEAFLQGLTELELAGLGYYAGAQGRVAGIEALVARTGYTGEDGFELVVPAAEGPRLWALLAARTEPAGATLCGLGARDTLRLEAGMALYGHEISEETNPYEAGLGRVVKLDKGEFVGRAALEALSTVPPKRRLVGFQMVDNGVPRQGYPIVDAEGAAVGEVSSGTHSPTLKRNLGLAYVAAKRAQPGAGVRVVVRERPLRALVVALPHVPHRTRRAPPKAAVVIGPRGGALGGSQRPQV